MALVVDDYGSIKGYLMEEIRGVTLFNILSSSITLDKTQTIQTIENVISALHKAETYHGDIKTDNVLIEAGTDRVVLIDPLPDYKENRAYSEINGGKEISPQEFDSRQLKLLISYTEKGLPLRLLYDNHYGWGT